MLEADYQFRCINGHLYLPKLRTVLEADFTRNVTANSVSEDQKARNDHGPPPKFNGTRGQPPRTPPESRRRRR
jgi:hypothetical protein